MIKDLFKDIAKYLPSMIIPAIFSIIAIPIITRLFLPNDYGNYALAMATISVLTNIGGWVISSVNRFYYAYEKKGESISFTGMVIKLFFLSILILSLIHLIINLFIKNIISRDFYHLLNIGIIVFIFISCFNVLLNFLRIKRLICWYSGFFVWKSMAALVFGLIFVIIFHFGVEGLLLGVILSIALALPLLWKNAIGKLWIRNKNLNFQSAIEMAKYSFPIVTGNLAAWILSLSDRYILKLFRGAQEVGIYSASYNIVARSVDLIVTLFMLASGPLSMYIWEKEGEDKSKEFINKIVRYYLIACCPAVIGLSILGKSIINIMTGEGYFEGYKIIPFVALGMLFFGLQQRFQAGFLFYKKTGFITFSVIVSGLLNLFLNFQFIPRYGYFAAAITTLISYAFLLFLMIILSRRFFVWKFPFTSLAKVICASAIMGIVVYYIGNSLTSSALINLILCIFIGMVVYFLTLLFLKEFSQEEIHILHLLKQKILK